ncbi:MAG: hypothetical protein RL538_385 [Candidatus Parcubacteria bacterium]|jgi:uncharacterized coiled-coil protein SlyX
MKKHISKVTLAVVFAAGAFLPTLHVEAALISEARLSAQREVIQEANRTVLEERLKLVQMLLINALGQRVEQLKEQVENQK